MKPWTFIMILVVLLMPGAEAAFGDQKGYGIQVGAFRDLKTAERETDKLKRLGHNAFYRPESVGGKGTWYRVYIEKFNSRKEAAKEAGVLKGLGLISEYAVRELDKSTASKNSLKEISEPKDLFYLQIGSFQGELNALNAAEHVKNHGYNAFYRREEVSGKTWFRVYIGKFDHRGDALKEGAALKKAKIVTDFKVKIFDKAGAVSGAAEGSHP